MNKVELSSAVLIHRRSYRDNSLLLDFYTKDHGKIRLIGRGIRKSKTNIQMFQHLKISFTGKGELKTLTHWDVDDSPRQIRGDTLILCMYVNELISILVQEHDPHPELFHMYISFIENVGSLGKKEQNWILRLFENNLLSELGYGLDYSIDKNGNKIEQDKNYEYLQQIGFSELVEGKISGKLLSSLNLGNPESIPSDEQLKVCRNLNRERLSLLLGNKKLKSRELFFVS